MRVIDLVRRNWYLEVSQVGSYPTVLIAARLTENLRKSETFNCAPKVLQVLKIDFTSPNWCFCGTIHDLIFPICTVVSAVEFGTGF